MFSPSKCHCGGTKPPTAMEDDAGAGQSPGGHWPPADPEVPPPRRMQGRASGSIGTGSLPPPGVSLQGSKVPPRWLGRWRMELISAEFAPTKLLQSHETNGEKKYK